MIALQESLDLIRQETVADQLCAASRFSGTRKNTGISALHVSNFADLCPKAEEFTVLRREGSGILRE
jgi:hypothetical protein